MGVELVRDEDPVRALVAVHGPSDVVDEIFLVARGTYGRCEHLPGGNDEIRDQAERSVTLVLELDLLNLAGSCRLGWVYSLQCLNAGLLVGADDVGSTLGESRCLAIRLADCFDARLVRYRVIELVLRGEPVATLVRPDGTFFRMRSRWRGEMPVTMPRFTTSSASSRGVQ